MKQLTRLTLWIRKLFGYRYLINHSSREVHDLKNEHVNCHINLIVNREFATPKRAMTIMAIVEEYNGCRWCNKKHDKG